MSPVSFAMLSGAGIVKGITGASTVLENNIGDEANNQKIYVHQTYDLVVEKIDTDFYARLAADVRDGVRLIATKEAPIYATILDSAGAQKFMLSAIAANEIFVAAKNATAPGSAATIGVRGVIDAAADADIYFKLVNAGNE